MNEDRSGVLPPGQIQQLDNRPSPQMSVPEPQDEVTPDAPRHDKEAMADGMGVYMGEATKRMRSVAEMLGKSIEDYVDRVAHDARQLVQPTIEQAYEIRMEKIQHRAQELDSLSEWVRWLRRSRKLADLQTI